MKTDLRLDGECWRLPLCRMELRRAFAVMLEIAWREGKLAVSDPCFELLIVQDSSIAALNQQYMRCPGPTNILSFPAAENNFVGSLVLSSDALYRESLLYAQKPREHCLRLLAHGIGHLLGLDHSAEMDQLCALMLAAALHS